jgi:very-short-patch-repair endonuclease
MNRKPRTLAKFNAFHYIPPMALAAPLTRPTLLAAGMSRSAIRHRIQIGTLDRIYAGVYVDAQAVDREAAIRSAWLLRAGAGAVFSFDTAAIAHNFDSTSGWDTGIHITQHNQQHVPRTPGVRFHRSRLLTPDQTETMNGQCFTTRARTLLDVLGKLTPLEGRRVFESAVRGPDPRRPHNWRVGLMDSIAEFVTAHPRHPGSTAARIMLRKVSHDFVPTYSIAETAAWQALEAAGYSVLRQVSVEAPDSRNAIRQHYLDLFIEQLRFNIEIDGAEHLEGARRKADLERDRRLSKGMSVLRFQASTALFEPQTIVAAVADEAQRRQHDQLTGGSSGWALTGTGLFRRLVRSR